MAPPSDNESHLARERREGEREPHRELAELVDELRVVLPGVTVLLAFLLTVPFSARFPLTSGMEKAAYFVAFLTAAMAVVFLIGESAYHRMVGKPYDKVLMLRTATRQTVVALALLSVSLACVVYLIGDFLYGWQVGLAASAGLLVLCAFTWFALPLARRQRHRG